MRLTKRDIHIMDWVNQFGYAEARQLAHHFDITLVSIYRRMKKLVDAGYAKHEHYLFDCPGVYRITAQGVEATQRSIAALRRVNLGTYQHQLRVVDVALYLSKQSEGTFITERSMRSKKSKKSIGQKGHMPDGIWRQDNRQFAIEVELSVKGTQRLEKIIGQYRQNFDFKEVWYFCGNNEVKNKLTRVGQKATFIKLYDVPELDWANMT